ncbi:MAG: DNA mismatch repair protein MutS [Eubacterium sp.]|nr:DNA mismatch repair protein MutS [Eubacterium sp.]
MMQQYYDTKIQYQDCLLFYRLGDFYEMFFEDAITASRELELTLTGRNCGMEERAPMCGVPFHAADTYIHKLVEKGYKVAICEQMEDPATAKGLVKREVIRIVTPGTLTSQTMLTETENNFLAALYFSKAGMSVSCCDISTGELLTTEEEAGRNVHSDMVDELCRIDAKEIIVNQSYADAFGTESLADLTGAYIDVKSDEYFSADAATDVIGGVLGKGAVIASGLEGRELCLSSLCALLSYLLETQKQGLKQIRACRFFELGKRMSLDKATLRNLEITETLYDKKRKGSLLGILDRTRTAMGARTMKKWLREPLNDAAAINLRLDAVEAISDDPLIENNLTESLRQIYDFERLAARIASGSANGRDLLALKRSIAVLPDIKADLSSLDAALLQDLAAEIADLTDVGEMIEAAVSEDCPFTTKEGGVIKDGYSEELDGLKASIRDAKEWIASLESRERERTGIKNLRVGYNKVFGYYIDVTKSNLALVPEDYVRKQTLVNNERYITPELKEMESLVLNAEVKINKTEYDIFCGIREKIEARVPEIQRTSDAVAALDVLTAFAAVSVRNGYVRPVIDDGLELVIEGGRHPVIEQMEGGGTFVSNDAYLNAEDASMMIITGPNMSGKSTYMRQTALIVLMAQAGCFVPCTRARIGVVDRIFTRIGASDNLSQGQSTFYVEMSELSYILGCAGPRSLVILDEIGRGTSTYDGLSIAWASVEYLCNEKRHIRTLFATHYHELTALEETTPGVKNLNVDVAEQGGDIVFLHKIVPGAASRSYGIHVAKLAGVPKVLLRSAEKKLAELEKNAPSGPAASPKAAPEEGMQLTLFAPGPGAELVERLRKLDLMEVTPSQAIRILEELKANID